MTTVVNTPADTRGESSGALWAVIILLLVGALLFLFGRPLLNGTVPGISIPDQVDINVNTPNQPAQ